MNYNLFKSLYSEALSYDDVDMYVAERGWQDWMDDFDESQLGPMLQEIYYLATHSLSEIRDQRKLSRAKFCRMFNIPIRTVENWDYGKAEMPDYLKILICYALFMENTL